MEGLELICFQMISASGAARSSYIEAIRAAKDGDIEKARNKIKDGEQLFLDGHQAHVKLLQQEMSGESATTVSLILLHAEDQMMAAEMFKILAEEFIDLYEAFNK